MMRPAVQRKIASNVLMPNVYMLLASQMMTRKQAGTHKRLACAIRACATAQTQYFS